MSTPVQRARQARLLQRIVNAGTVVQRYVTKDDVAAPAPSGDMSSGDLAAGGLKAPAQGLPAAPPKLKKPHGTVLKTVDFQGLPVHVDRPRGFVQSGMDEKGQAWKRIYHVDYGYVPNTAGGDGESVDVYLGLDNEAKDAHWILQKKLDGTFDEYKVMLGFPDADMAKGMYLAHTPKKFLGGVATTSVAMMKALLGLHPSETLKALSSFMAGASVGEQMLREAWAIEKVLKEESDGWHVYSEDGSKHLGGPYDSKAKAVERLRQVEGHKEKSLKLVSALAKADPAGEQRYLLGIVLEPEVVDAQGRCLFGRRGPQGRVAVHGELPQRRAHAQGHGQRARSARGELRRAR
jgi:hypothetical protein